MIDTLNIEVQLTTNSRLPEVNFNDLKFGRVFSDHMLVADYENGQWTQCQIVPFGNLSISPANATLHYGQTIFEGLKAYLNDAGEALVFRPEDNYERMVKSAERMCMPAVPKEIFMEGLKQLLQVDKEWIPKVPGGSLYIRPFMFASEEFIGIRPAESYKFVIFTCPVGTYYTEPVKVKIETHYTRAIEGGTGFAKTAANYAISLYPARMNQQKGYHQLVWTDGKEHKYIEESGTMNIIFRKGNTIITPVLGDTILDGITRRSVLQLAKDWGYEVQERKVPVTEIVEYLKNNELDEVFGAGTAATIAHIVLMHHEGTDYHLPAIETRSFSNKVLQTLNDLKHGLIPDEYGWVMKVD